MYAIEIVKKGFSWHWNGMKAEAQIETIQKLNQILNIHHGSDKKLCEILFHSWMNFSWLWQAQCDSGLVRVFAAELWMLIL